MTNPTDSIDNFKSFIRDRTRETWDQRGIPYYLSFVAIDLKKLGNDYHTLLGPLKLSQWAASNDIPEIRLVSHPTQKAKIGFVPIESNFDFGEHKVSPKSSADANSYHTRSRALFQFVQSLTALPESALEDFHVPAKTLIAFLKR